MKYKKGIVFPLRAMKAYMMSGGIAPLIFNLGSRWRSVVSLTPPLLYPRVKSSRHLDNIFLLQELSVV